MRWQGRSRRKYSGGRYHYARRKREFEAGRPAAETSIRDAKIRQKKNRTRGGNKKIRLFAGNLANVADPRSGVTKTAKIIGVKTNSANPFYVRRNIITKGAVIETDLGNAVVTSRPGQHAVVNAVLIT
jgi:small subunit ribosomal protein S8e